MIRAILVDDEVAALGMLADLLLANGKVEIVGKFTNPREALEQVSVLSFDVAFLDIEMPGIHGMELANRLLDIVGVGVIQIVFVTAYSEYAIPAFELNATDYLLKPVTRKRINNTLARISSSNRPISKGHKLRVTCFGRLAVASIEGRLVKWRTNKTEALFAYLFDQGGKETGKEKIIATIWPEFDEKRALSNFSSCLYYLRKTLNELGFPELIVRANSTFKLNMEQISSDLQQLERCMAVASSRNDKVIAECEAFTNAYTGGYFEQNYYDWADGKRRLLDEKVLELHLHLAIYYRDRNEMLAAVRSIQKGLQWEPLHPLLNQTLMEIYLLDNNRYAASEHYEEYMSKLASEFGDRSNPYTEEWLAWFDQMNPLTYHSSRFVTSS